VGKTTCAAARAVAEAAAGLRVLVVSTDPAHSLGDALAVRLSATPRPIRARLRALELDAPRAVARWLRDHRRPLGDILEHGTWLDRGDVEALMDLSVPGVDELVGLLEIGRLTQSGTADLIVVDTAPTGHTLRLLAAPETVGAVAEAFDAMQADHRVIRRQLAGVGRPEAADRLIDLLSTQARETSARLRDSNTQFHWVTLPEQLSIAETADAIASLQKSRLNVSEIVINRVLPADGACPICDRRRARERATIDEIHHGVGRGRTIRVIAAAQKEPRGIAALARIGAALRAKPAHPARPTARTRGPLRGIALSIPDRVETVSSSAARAVSARLRLRRRPRCASRAPARTCGCCCSRPTPRIRSPTSSARR
jgi:arsenite-transporting ATPase